jgi:endonuclease/exonuclease/phosphatase family metal-dependent hydrolase
MLSRQLRIVTFNVLAPCYHRLASVEQHISEQKRNFWHAEANELESDHKELYTERFNNVTELLRNSDLDIACIQEFWFTAEMKRLFEKNLIGKGFHHALYLQRTRGRKDGLAMFINTEKLEIVASKDILFKDVGHRVAQLVHVRMKDTHTELIIVNTHLTFPHNDYDENILRIEQANKITDNLTQYIRELEQEPHVVIAGDLNTVYSEQPESDECMDKVLAHLYKSGFRSGYKMVNNSHDFVSHFSHKNEPVGADYVLVSSELNVSKAVLLPELVDDKKWPDKDVYQVSDHRPVLVDINY